MTPHIRVGMTVRRPGIHEDLIVLEINGDTITVADIQTGNLQTLNLSHNPYLTITGDDA